jgi:D-glycero-D-manno-heptose 1,7-bisphosphate phosphatase
MVGDRVADLEAGRRAGARSVLVRTGYGENTIKEAGANLAADHVADDLPAAVKWILQQE